MTYVIEIIGKYCHYCLTWRNKKCIGNRLFYMAVCICKPFYSVQERAGFILKRYIMETNNIKTTELILI